MNQKINKKTTPDERWESLRMKWNLSGLQRIKLNANKNTALRMACMLHNNKAREDENQRQVWCEFSWVQNQLWNNSFVICNVTTRIICTNPPGYRLLRVLACCALFGPVVFFACPFCTGYLFLTFLILFSSSDCCGSSSRYVLTNSTAKIQIWQDEWW